MNNRISFITFLVSCIISAASAYCTVVGFGNVFVSAPIITMMISAVIELGRVVLVYDLHHFWHIMPWFKKLPGILMLCIAVSLSAMGIFGFFANAHSANTREVLPIQMEIEQIESSVKIAESEIELNNKQIAQIQLTMNSESMSKAMDKYIEKEYVTKALNMQKDQQKQITSLSNSNKELNKTIIDQKKKIVELQKESESKAPTIAHLKYFSKLFGIDNDAAIVLFIVMIMMVFDTLAMYLMITSDWIKTLDEPKPSVKKEKIEPIQVPTEEPKSEPIKEIVPEIKVEQPKPKKKTVKKIKNNIEKESQHVIKLDTTKNEIPVKEEIISKNNIDKKVKKLVELIKKDSSIIDTKTFVDSISKTPLIVNKLGEELGEDNEIMIKLRSNLK